MSQETIRFVESGNTPPETQGKQCMEQQSNRVWSKVETITPQIAQEYLAMNIVNRPLRKIKVAEYADAMLRGQWQLNGEAICFDVKGHLVNGQHRLNAVIKAKENNPDVVFQTVVVRGVAEDSFLTFDSGAARKLTDVFYLSDVKNGHAVSALINKILQWRKTTIKTLNHRDRSSICISKQDCLNEYNSNPEYYQTVVGFCNIWYKTLRMLGASDIGVMYVWLNKDLKHDDDVVYNFFDTLFSMKESSINAIMLLRQRLLQDKMSNVKIPSAYKYALIAKTWNAYITGNDIKCLRWNESKEGKIDFI